MTARLANALFIVFILIGCAFADWRAPVLVDSLEYNYEIPDILARNDTVYITCNNFFIRSIDGGLTWSDRRQFGDWAWLDAYSGLQGDTICVFWAIPHSIWMTFSTNGGSSWQESRYTMGSGAFEFCRDDTVIYECFGSNGSNQGNFYFSKSTDFGLSWPDLRLIHVYDNSLAFFVFKKHFDRLYILSDIVYGFFSNLRLLYSTDDGESWANNDSLTSIIVGYGYPQLAASTNGRMAFVYHIWDPDWHLNDSSYVKISVSSDSGTTWAPPIDISHSTFTNCIPSLDMGGDTIVASWYTSQGMVVRRSYNLGQTWQDVEVLGGGDSDIALDNGVIHLAYRASGHRLMYRRWDPGTGDVGEYSPPAIISISQAYPNPFNSQAIIKSSLTRAGEITISIYDIMGRKLMTLLKGFQQAGEHSAVWDASAFPSGIYFARIETDGRKESVKLILLK